VGYAGLKDKAARTTQVLSIPVSATPPGIEAEMAARITDALPVEVHWARLHRNKLKVGHLLGNRFQIQVDEIALPLAEALARAEAIGAELRRWGAPNYFGPQRFGGHGDNAVAGYELLTGKRRLRDQWLRRFLISGYQSHLCNQVLALRIQRGAFTHLLSGDIAKKQATGGIFDVEDLAAEQPRFDAHEISYTLPLFGAKMRRARGDAGALEASVEAETGLTDAEWKAARIEGTRRAGRLLVPDLMIEPMEQPSELTTAGLILRFTLPKGGFATSLLREVMKSDEEPLPAQEAEVEA
jgi:tRNA pseudouridine13 synthase